MERHPAPPITSPARSLCDAHDRRTRPRSARDRGRLLRIRRRVGRDDAGRAAGRPRGAVPRADRPPAGRDLHRRRRGRRPDGRRRARGSRICSGSPARSGCARARTGSDYVHPGRPRRAWSPRAMRPSRPSEPFHVGVPRGPSPTGASCGSARTRVLIRDDDGERPATGSASCSTSPSWSRRSATSTTCRAPTARSWSRSRRSSTRTRPTSRGPPSTSRRRSRRSSGVTPEEWTGDSKLWSEMLHPDDRDRAIEEVDRGIESGRALHGRVPAWSRATAACGWFQDTAVMLARRRRQARVHPRRDARHHRAPRGRGAPHLPRVSRQPDRHAEPRDVRRAARARRWRARAGPIAASRCSRSTSTTSSS